MWKTSVEKLQNREGRVEVQSREKTDQRTEQQLLQTRIYN